MMLSTFVAAAALATSPYRPLGEEGPVAASAACAKKEKDMRSKATGSEGIANLPYAMGRRFRTLDEYLEHLRCNAAPIDLPWWREARPGVYERVKRMRNATPEVATRAELMKRFGFTS